MQKSKAIIENSRALRANPTRAEILLWSRLKREQLGVKFRRQHPIDHYIVDFFCPSCRLVIELDGGQHTEETDEKREQYLRNQGLQIVRFWNNNVIKNVDEVVAAIKRVVDSNMSPPPARA